MNPFEQLLTQSSGSNVAPETLEMLGRQASQLFQSQGIPLNQAVSQILAHHPELENEHIKRIIEFANTVTFQEMFQNSPDKNVHFDVADPGVVTRDLRDGGSSAHAGKTLNSDYQKLPQTSQDSELDSALMQQFTGSSTPNSEATKVADVKKNLKLLGGVAAVSGVAGGAGYTGMRVAKGVLGPEKTASALRDSLAVDHEKHINPVDDLYDTQIKLSATREKLASSYESLYNLMHQAQDDFYRQVRIQIDGCEGSGLGGVLSALEKIASQDLVETIVTPVAQRLVLEGYDGDRLTRSMSKTAGTIPNLEHPLFAAFDAIVKTAEELGNCDQALDDIDKMLEDVKVPFKKIAGALTTNIKNTIGVAGSVPAGIRQRFPRN